VTARGGGRAVTERGGCVLVELGFLLLTYLVAAVPFGVVVTTLAGVDVDVRASGSGNIGTTNVARVAGWRVAGPVLALDALKGFVPVALAPFFWSFDAAWLPTWGAVVALTAFVGHCWPIYLELRGGKGVATGAGALLALAPEPTLLAIVVWIAVLALTGRSSVAALGATFGLVAFSAWLAPGVLPVTALLALGVLIRHVANIRRLVHGEEQELVRPVRWGGRRQDATLDDVLAQGPSGGASASIWHPVDQAAVPRVEDGE
jgi:glycerol-3-phosphate acyltransferase PlsY